MRGSELYARLERSARKYRVRRVLGHLHRLPVTCGTQAPANTITDAGPICARCYNLTHKGQCDRCGRTRPGSYRADVTRIYHLTCNDIDRRAMTFV